MYIANYNCINVVQKNEKNEEILYIVYRQQHIVNKAILLLRKSTVNREKRMLQYRN